MGDLLQEYYDFAISLAKRAGTVITDASAQRWKHPGDQKNPSEKKNSVDVHGAACFYPDRPFLVGLLTRSVLCSYLSLSPRRTKP
jgi:hypothetical protein